MKVIFSDSAFAALLSEVNQHPSTETGGIFLGHKTNDVWYIIEVIEPGPHSKFLMDEFEYDTEYVNYKANKLNRLYKMPLEVLGLWHKHPGTMNFFSATDDITNQRFASIDGNAISGIVTLGGGFRLTMYYVPVNLDYKCVSYFVSSQSIPPEFQVKFSVKEMADFLPLKAKRSKEVSDNSPFSSEIIPICEPEQTQPIDSGRHFNRNNSLVQEADSCYTPGDNPPQPATKLFSRKGTNEDPKQLIKSLKNDLNDARNDLRKAEKENLRLQKQIEAAEKENVRLQKQIESTANQYEKKLVQAGQQYQKLLHRYQQTADKLNSLRKN